MAITSAHRAGDQRFCGAATIVVGQGFVKVNGNLWAVENDPNSHGNGQLTQSYGPGSVKISGKKVIVVGDMGAKSDNAFHPFPPTDPSTGSSSVYAYKGTGGGTI